MPIKKPLAACQEEAYTKVLRAFQAQKNNDWSRQKLLRNLRRKLEISEDKHLIILNEVADNSEPRDLSGGPGAKNPRRSSERLPDTTTKNVGVLNTNLKQPPQKREPSQDTSQEKWLSKKSQGEARSPKEPSRGKRSSPSKGGSQGGNHASNQRMAPPSSRKPRNTPSHSGGPPPNSTNSTLTPTVPPNIHRLGPDDINKFVGRQVESFWPDQDPQWIEAVITDYNVESRKHCLTYDFNTVNESWEWVELDKMLSEGQVRLLGGPSLAPEVLAGAGRVARVGAQTQVGTFGSVLGKRPHPSQNEHANGFGDTMEAPFDADYFDKKLQHGTLEELEAMHRSVVKRQKVVVDRMLGQGEEGLKKIQDPLVRALLEREYLSRRAEDLTQELTVLGSQEK